MKILVLLACVSLSANAVLGYLYWHRPPAAVATAATPSSRQDQPVRQPEKADAVASGTTAVDKAGREDGITTTKLPDIGPALTAAIKSRDSRALLLALREAGFPEKFIREIVLWDLDAAISREKRVALMKESIERPFWKSETVADRRAWDKALADLAVMDQASTKEIFGGAVPPLPQLTAAHRMLGFLPEDKIERVADLDNDYAAMQNETLRAGGANRAESLALLNKEKYADLAKILTPEELELYDLYTSPAATYLRRQMNAFTPTEAEFRAMYDVRRAFDEEHPVTELLDRTSLVQRQAADQALQEQFRSILGDARYADYQRAQDRGYQVAVEVVRHFNLPAENAAATYDLQRSTQQQIQDLAKTAAADPEALRLGTQAIVAEANAKLTKLLGAPGADAYLKAGGSLQRTIPTGPGGAPAIILRPAGG